MTINVDIASQVPIYQQVRGQIVKAIADGVLTDGSTFPVTRALAADLRVAPSVGDRCWPPRGERW